MLVILADIEAIEKLATCGPDGAPLEGQKPLPSEHSARIEAPDKYDSFRRDNDKFGPGIHAIWGILDGPPRKAELQAIRFSADKFTADEAKAWLKEHDYKPISFEAASGGGDEEDDEEEGKMAEAQPKKTSCGYKVLQVDREERTAVFAINTDDVDRDGEVLMPQGANLKHYNSNPVVLYGHDYNSLPVARALWTRKTKEDGRQVLLSKPKFANTDFANDVFNLVADGFLSTASVGFIPSDKQGRAPTEEEVKGRPDWAKATRIYDKWDLLEWSIVPVPSNPFALARAVVKGLRLPKGMDLGTLGEADKETEPATPWNPSMWEKEAHEAIWAAIELFREDSLTRQIRQYEGKEYIVIFGMLRDVKQRDGQIREGGTATYKTFYPIVHWTEQDALFHAADRRAIGFIEFKDRVRKLSPIPTVREEPVMVRRLEPIVSEKPYVRRRTSDAEIRETEEARARGKIIN